MTRDRGLTGPVGKSLEVAIVVLFIGLLSTTLFGGVVPEYRSAAGTEVGERVLALSAERIQQTVPPSVAGATARHRVDLPRTIRGKSYQIRTEGRTLVLDHPHPAVGGQTPVALPASATLSGSWESHGDPAVVVRETQDGPTVRLVS